MPGLEALVVYESEETCLLALAGCVVGLGWQLPGQHGVQLLERAAGGEEVVEALLRAVRSRRQEQLAHAILHKALKQAVLWGLIAYNPADRVVSLKPIRREFATLSAEQVGQLLAGQDEGQWRTLLTVAVSTGVRQGELLGLQWQDIDLEGGTLSVRRSLQFITGQGLVLADVKTNRSRRTIALTELAKAALKSHKVAQNEHRLQVGPAWVDRGLVFTTASGGPLEPGTVTNRFKRGLASMELPAIRFHDLRHTAATLMLQSGVHPKVVQEMLGHANIGVTMDTYSHVLPNMQQDAANAMDRLLRGAR